MVDLDEFRERGFVRVPGAFPAEAARAMRDAVWDELARRGIERDDPATWTDEAPSHLQPLKRMRVFRAADTPRTVGAIDAILGEGAWNPAANAGAFFILFPSRRPWTAARGPWHVDAPYCDALDPPNGVKVHTVFGDIAPRAGGMHVVVASHRAVARCFTDHPPEPGTPDTKLRKRVIASDPWLRDLDAGVGDPDERIARFIDSTGEVHGVEVRVEELTGEAGDIILMHPLLLHARPTNAGTLPRFLLNRDLRRR